MFVCYLLWQQVAAFDKTLAKGVISLPGSLALANRPVGKSMFLDGYPLCGSTLLPPWDRVLLHSRFHRISPDFILRTIGLWVVVAPNVLTPCNMAVVFKGRQFFQSETNL